MTAIAGMLVTGCVGASAGEVVAGDSPGAAESVTREPSSKGSETGKSKSTKGKSTKSKKSSSKKGSSKKPAVQLSGKLYMRLVYDDNIIRYSDEDLSELETNPTPGKYSINSADDWVLRPRIDLVATTRRLTGEKLEARLRVSSWQYAGNGVKDNESISLRLKHPAFGKDNFQLTFYHAPEAYLRNFRDRPEFVPRSTPMEYTPFSYTSTSLGLGYWRRMKSWLDGKLEIKRSWRYYNQAFMENDNWEWRIGGYLAWRVVKLIKITGEYYYTVADARGRDSVVETAEDSNDGDASYERDWYEVTLGLYIPKNALRLSRISISGQYQAYYFTSSRDPAKDRYHVGRKDSVYRTELVWSTRSILQWFSLEGGYRHTRRDSSAPFEGGEGESIDEAKDYTDNRFWVGMIYSF